MTYSRRQDDEAAGVDVVIDAGQTPRAPKLTQGEKHRASKFLLASDEQREVILYQQSRVRRQSGALVTVYRYLMAT